MAAYCTRLYFVILLSVSVGIAASGRLERELPLSYNCDPRLTRSCYKGDLIATNIADCEREASSFNFYTCDPIDGFTYTASSVVDVPDVSTHGVDCVAKSGRPIKCGAAGTDTRCVCDKAVDYKRPKETFLNQCRCQYWPLVDTRMNDPSYCTQFDHGGVSGIHFYTCCNSCNDADSSCNSNTYQGGASTDNYCSTCGRNSAQGGGRITYRFNCVSCDQQTICENTCNKNWLSKNVPGLCPKWSGCFRGCCLKAQQNSIGKREISGSEVGEFCGDFVCQTGEDHSTCPTDCCPVYNPAECDPDSCNPDCCYEPRCCILEQTSTGSQSKLCPCSLLTIGGLGSFLVRNMLFDF